MVSMEALRESSSQMPGQAPPRGPWQMCPSPPMQAAYRLCSLSACRHAAQNVHTPTPGTAVARTATHLCPREEEGRTSVLQTQHG